jgi:uncharacterized membrane protein YhaH (DUF805 family)
VGRFFAASQRIRAMPFFEDAGDHCGMLRCSLANGQELSELGRPWVELVSRSHQVVRGLQWQVQTQGVLVLRALNIIVSIVLGWIDALLGTRGSYAGAGLLSGIYSLAVLIPSLAVTVRRLHDIDRSGWWILIGLVPLIGVIVLLVFALLDGTPGDNRYGSNPKGVTARVD